MLFACTKCHSRHPFEDLSKEEQLCKACRRKYPLTPCQYCQMEYHIMKKVDGSPVCTKCSQNISSYGMPKACKYCQILAAFKTSYCVRCISSRKKYGEPVPCQQCKKKCAFNKTGDSKEKVGGQVLCLKCTLGYKKQKHQQQKLLKKDDNFVEDASKHYSKTKSTSAKVNKNYPSLSASGDKLANLSSTDKVIAPLKAENLAKTFKSRIDTVDVRTGNRSTSPFVSNTKQKLSPSESNNDSKLEPSFGDHMSEMTKLRDEIAMLKKVISQKDKIILEKDKKINEFNAGKWDLEKLQRQKISVIQKDFETGLHKLRLENGELKRQVSMLKKKKAKFDEQNAKKSGKIRLEVFKPHSPALTPSKSYLDSQSENTDSDNEVKINLKELNKETIVKKEVKKIDSGEGNNIEDASKINKEAVLETDDIAFATEKSGSEKKVVDNTELKATDNDEIISLGENKRRKRRIKNESEEEGGNSGSDDEAINVSKKKKKSELSFDNEEDDEKSEFDKKDVNKDLDDEKNNESKLDDKDSQVHADIEVDHHKEDTDKFVDENIEFDGDLKVGNEDEEIESENLTDDLIEHYKPPGNGDELFLNDLDSRSDTENSNPEGLDLKLKNIDNDSDVSSCSGDELHVDET